MTALHTWARYYAARGWPVFPLIPRTKKPIHAGGFKNASTDLAQVDAWWAEHPDANIGIPTGVASGLFLVDLDDKDGRSGSDHWADLVARHDGDGSPLEVYSGSGGLHLLYAHVPGLVNSASKLAPDVDTRGEGGYFVAAPSIHPCGKPYQWGAGALDLQPVPPPAWLVETAMARKVLPDAAPAKLDGAHAATREDLEAFITYKAKYPDAADHVLVARAVLAGTSWGKGARHSRMVAFLGALRVFIASRHGASLHPEGTAELFHACTAAATDEGVNAPTDAEWVAGLIRTLRTDDAQYLGKLEAARAQKKADRLASLPSKDLELPEVASAARPWAQEGEAHPATGHALNIKRAFGTERTNPYTDEELQALMPIDKRWLLLTPAGYFLRAPGGDYIPVIEKAVLVKARDVLAPACVAGVELVEQTDKGERLLSREEILSRYGQAPTHTMYSYCAPRSTLDGDTFVQRTGTPKKFAPEHNAEIARWLELFAGEQYEALLDWLATLTQLSKPTAGLCIMGTSGAGKDLLIEGLAEIWGGSRLSFERALHKFNNALIDSPLVVANEEVRTPREFSGSAADALKEMISDVKRKVEAKYGGAVDLRGCLRVILASNADGGLTFSRSPTPSDIVALDERILLLRPSEECKRYLESLGGLSATEAWVSGGGIARHVAWLQETRVVVPGPRFLVQGRGGLSDLLSADGKGSAAVLRALLDALLGPKDKDARIVQLRDGDVWASASRLKAAWPTYGAPDELPEDFGGATENVFVRGSGEPVKVAGELIKMRKVKWPVLLRAAQKGSRLDDLLATRQG